MVGISKILKQMALTEEVIREFTAAKYAYDAGANPLEKIGLIGLKCYEELENNAEEIEQGSYNSTMYHVFEANSAFSRPIRPDLFVTSKTYAEEWESVGKFFFDYLTRRISLYFIRPSDEEIKHEHLLSCVMIGNREVERPRAIRVLVGSLSGFIERHKNQISNTE